MKTKHAHIILPKLVDFMQLYFRGVLSKLSPDYGDKHINMLITKVIDDNEWRDFIRIYDVNKVLRQKGNSVIPILDLIPDDIDIEYMWMINNPEGNHIVFCLDDTKVINACSEVIEDILR